MKKFFWILLWILPALPARASTDYPTLIRETARKTAEKLNRTGGITVAVYPFYDQNHRYSDLSKYVSEDFSVFLNHYRQNFKIIDRSYLEQMLEEHQLNAEGLIDPRTAKRFGMIIAADYYITGKITLFEYSFQLTVHVINTETGERLYSDVVIIPLDRNLAILAGIHDWDQRQREQVQRDEKQKCVVNRTGHVCFVNRTGQRYRIQYQDRDAYYGDTRYLSLAPHSRNCIFDLPAGHLIQYKALKSQIFIGDIVPSGVVAVKVCRTVEVPIE